MYSYTEFDNNFNQNRVDQFRSQVTRRIDGSLTEDEFKPLRLMNGLYLQLHAYMLRVAIPYGTLNSQKMYQLAIIADKYDRGYGHFTTRQNIQYNWPKLKDVPDILQDLANVEMHAVQTSGNCIRNVTADHFAGASTDEIEDPRPTAELIRQWSTDHPEFSFLGRKFKIAITGSPNDRAVTKAHDIGLRMVRNNKNEPGYEVIIGGGLGRTPTIGKVLRSFLPRKDILPYLESVMQIYNMLGRRDNKYKARIKITVHEHGINKICDLVEERFIIQRSSFGGFDQKLLIKLEKAFAAPIYINEPIDSYNKSYQSDPLFRSFVDTNLSEHKNLNYSIVSISLKKHGQTPGDATSQQMRMMANLAKKYGHDELRISHEQNVILPHVHKSNLYKVFNELKSVELATANIGLISDIIACPGMDYCALATARSIPIAQQIAMRFNQLKLENDIGEIKIKISGCINACGHHHIGHIGILGLDRAGVENYQITLGGNSTQNTVIGKSLGPGFSYTEIIPAIEKIIYTYLDIRSSNDETFLETFNRVGLTPFKKIVYTPSEIINKSTATFANNNNESFASQEIK